MTDTTDPRLGSIGEREFVVMISVVMALTALAIDLMLPAFPEIRAAFGLAPDATDVAAIVTTFFIGLAIGMLFMGLLADRYGRKRILYLGFGMYALGAVGAAVAPSLELLLASRVFWGIGAAAPRVLAITIIRDTHEGDHMARVMSFIMAIFVVIPAFAPGIGRAIILLAPWRGVFWFCFLFVVALAAWTTRMPETLRPENRIAINRADVIRTLRRVVTTRQTVGMTLVMMLAFGAFTSFLGSSEIIIREIYDLEAWFPLIFGGVAGLMGVTLLANATLVGRWTSQVVANRATLGFAAGSVALLAVGMSTDGSPPLWLFLGGLAAVFIPFALLVPNLNTLAMIPVGDVAGTASAFVGFVSTAGGAIIGAVIDRSYDGSVMPMAIGFFLAGIAALGVMLLTERGLVLRQTEPAPHVAG